MNQDDPIFLKEFYRRLSDRPLEPGDPLYVHLYGTGIGHPDPVEDLAKGIEWADTLETAQLFSGFRGTGKSTELRRLKARLEQAGNFKVVLCDMQSYLNLTWPVDISDFLIAVAGAFSEALAEDPDLLGKDLSKESYWERLGNFIKKTNISIDGLSVGAEGVGVKANLKQDPSFKKTLQDEMKGHLGALSDDVQKYMKSCVEALKKKHGDETQVVLLLDSIEQIRGTSVNEKEVYASVETLFQGHSDKLKFPYIHTVYTVPPWLKIRSPGVAGLYSNSEHLPCIKVRNPDGTPNRQGLDAVETLVAKRGDWQRLLGNRETLDKIVSASGGFLRDLFRLLQRCLRQAADAPLPINDNAVEMALHHVRNSYLPIATSDAVWLNRVGRTHRAELAEGERLGDLSRFFDTHLVLCYRNGEEWYDVHPLIADHVKTLASGEPT